MNETMSKEAQCQLYRLTYPALVKRHIRTLQNASCIAVSLGMTHDQNCHVTYRHESGLE